MSVIGSNTLAGASGQGGGGYEIERSLKFNSTDSANLSRTPTSEGNRNTFTFSFWVKRTALGTSNRRMFGADASGVQFNIMFDANDRLYIQGGLHPNTFALITERKFRDPSAWYHFVISFDKNAATTVRIYCNGSEITTFATSDYPVSTDSFGWNATVANYIGTLDGTNGNWDGMLANVDFIDGQALAASDFGEFDDNNVWQPKKYSGSYGTNGVHLDFSDNSSASALGTDSSGNGNDWTVNNLSVASGADNDSLRDSPTNGDPTNDTGVGGEVVSNYATMNPLYASDITLSDGNLKITKPGGADRSTIATIGVNSGKWYWEATINMFNYHYPGVAEFDIGPDHYGGQNGSNSASIEIYATGYIDKYNGNIATGGTAQAVGTVSGTPVIGMALDLDSNPKTLKYYNNGTLISGLTKTITSTKTLFPAHSIYNQGSGEAVYNFGQRPFHTAAPAGYKCLCTANLPDPTIEDGSTAFDAKAFTANNGTQTISGFNFSPDLVWTKSRANAYAHQLWDQVRGADKALSSNDSTAEANLSSSLTFTSDGFTSNTNNNANYGTGGSIAWAWDAGSSNTSIAAGSLNSSLYNQSEDWSSKITANGVTIEVTDAMFDGNHPATPARIFRGTGGVKLTHTFTGVTSIRVACYNYSTWNYFEVNGSSSAVLGTETTSNSLATWNDLTVPADGNVSSIEWGYTSTANYYCSAIEINGQILVNNDITPPNVPSIASTARTNPSAGFSIVKWNNGTISSTASVAHGLNSAPDFYTIKSIDSADSWYTYHNSMGNTKYLTLDTGTAATTSSTMWGDTSPDSNTFPVGTTFNGTGDYIAYCFAPVEGYSSFGIWDGNASVNGPFVYTGFKPAFILLKGIGAAHYWAMHDDARDPTNTGDKYYVWANDPGQEYTGYDVDFLSNGFKLRNNNGNWNTTGYGNDKYIYAAFAEHPFKTARAS